MSKKPLRTSHPTTREVQKCLKILDSGLRWNDEMNGEAHLSTLSFDKAEGDFPFHYARHRYKGDFLEPKFLLRHEHVYHCLPAFFLDGGQRPFQGRLKVLGIFNQQAETAKGFNDMMKASPGLKGG